MSKFLDFCFYAALIVIALLGSGVVVLNKPKPAEAQFYTRVGSPNQEWKVSNAGIGATLTEIKPIPTSATQHHVITLFFNQSTTSTANQWSIQSGTGTNCGTGTTAVLPGSATTDKYIGVANTSPPQVLPFYPIPIHVTAGHAICVLGIATQLTRLDMLGYTIP